jgi:predicted RNase H-like HicB family nuclease
MIEQVVMVIHEVAGRFRASFPDFPGCTAESDTRDDLYDKGADALHEHVARLVIEGQPIPHIRTEKELQAKGLLPSLFDAVVDSVEIDLPAKPKGAA